MPKEKMNEYIAIGGKRWPLRVTPADETEDTYISTDFDNFHKLDYIKGLQPKEKYIKEGVIELYDVKDNMDGNKPTAWIDINEKGQVIKHPEMLEVAYQLRIPLGIRVRPKYNARYTLKSREVNRYSIDAYLQTFMQEDATKESYKNISKGLLLHKEELTNTVLTALNCGMVYEPCTTTTTIFKKGKMVVTKTDLTFGLQVMQSLKVAKELILKQLYTVDTEDSLKVQKITEFESEANWDKALLFGLKVDKTPEYFTERLRKLAERKISIFDKRSVSDIIKELSSKLSKSEQLDTTDETFDLAELFSKWSKCKKKESQNIDFWYGLEKDTSSYEEQRRLLAKAKASEKTLSAEALSCVNLKPTENAEPGAHRNMGKAKVVQGRKTPLEEAEVIHTVTGKAVYRDLGCSDIPFDERGISHSGEVVPKRKKN